VAAFCPLFCSKPKIEYGNPRKKEENPTRQRMYNSSILRENASISDDKTEPSLKSVILSW
jgi:hypothetical protein